MGRKAARVSGGFGRARRRRRWLRMRASPRRIRSRRPGGPRRAASRGRGTGVTKNVVFTLLLSLQRAECEGCFCRGGSHRRVERVLAALASSPRPRACRMNRRPGWARPAPPSGWALSGTGIGLSRTRRPGPAAPRSRRTRGCAARHRRECPAGAGPAHAGPRPAQCLLTQRLQRRRLSCRQTARGLSGPRDGGAGLSHSRRTRACVGPPVPPDWSAYALPT